MTTGYDGSLPPADGRAYYWNAHTLAWTATDEDLYDFEVPPRPTTDEEFAALPILNLNDFHQEQP